MGCGVSTVTTKMSVPSLPRSLGTSILICLLNEMWFYQGWSHFIPYPDTCTFNKQTHEKLQYPAVDYLESFYLPENWLTKQTTVHYCINWQQCSEYFDYKSEILVGCWLLTLHTHTHQVVNKEQNAAQKTGKFIKWQIKWKWLGLSMRLLGTVQYSSGVTF